MSGSSPQIVDIQTGEAFVRSDGPTPIVQIKIDPGESKCGAILRRSLSIGGCFALTIFWSLYMTARYLVYLSALSLHNSLRRGSGFLFAVVVSLLALFLPFTSATAQTTHPLVFSTFLGGSGVENLRDVTSDRDGNIYVTGGTSSTDYPTTSGAYDRTFASGGTSLGSGGPMDAFVAKYDGAGNLIWSTYLGGPNYDRAYAIEVDRDGYVYVAGRAGDGFPTTAGALQEQFAGDKAQNNLYGKQDGFVAKLSPNGDSLIWATYIGGDDAGFLRDMDIDLNGIVYVVVANVSRPMPYISSNAFQKTPAGGTDVVVACIAPDGSAVRWASYFGGSGDDGAGPSIRVATDRSVTVVGSTTSTDLPIAGAGSDGTFNGGERDLFVAHFAAGGGRLIYSTYFGGSGNESVETHSVALDDDGNAFVSGVTTSTDLPVTPGAFRSVSAGKNDMPVGKFAATDGSLLACTYLGGSQNDGCQGVAIGKNGTVVIGGVSTSPDYPVSSHGGVQGVRGESDMVATVLTPDLRELVWSGAIGGSGADEGRTLWADRIGNIYLAGHSASTDFPLVDAAQPNYGGGTADGILTRWCPPFEPEDVMVLRMYNECMGVMESYGQGFFLIYSPSRSSRPVRIRLQFGGTATFGQDHMASDTIITLDTIGSYTSYLFDIIDDDEAEPIEYLEVRATIVEGDSVILSPETLRIYIHDNDDGDVRNLLVNPGFEDGTEGWRTTDSRGVVVATDRPRSGVALLNLESMSEGMRDIYQDVRVTPGMDYLATGGLRFDITISIGAIVEVVWLDAEGYVIAESEILWANGPSNSPDEWSYGSTCLKAPPNAATARFRIRIPADAVYDGLISLDDLGLYRTDGTTDVESGEVMPEWLRLW